CARYEDSAQSVTYYTFDVW
nr:immunoglobulin heavy chain junction region [Macaca mulatta]